HVLNNIVVVTDQYPTFPVADLKDAIRIAGRKVSAEEWMQFAEPGHPSVLVDTNVSVEQTPITVLLKKTRKNMDVVLSGDFNKLLYARAIGHFFRDVQHFLPRQVPCK